MEREGTTRRPLPTLLALPLAAAVALGTARSSAQTQAPRTYSLDQVVAEALAHHPRLRASGAEERVAYGLVDEARTGDIPHAGVSAELNRSTGNTPPGAFYPAS